MKRYSLEFRLQAVELAKSIGVPAAARELCLARQLLSTWCYDETYLRARYEEEQQEMEQEQDRKSRPGSILGRLGKNHD